MMNEINFSEFFPPYPKEGDVFQKIGEIVLPYSGKTMKGVTGIYYYHDNAWVPISNIMVRKI